MTSSDAGQRARELHPAGTDRRVEVVEAAGVDKEVGVAPWPILIGVGGSSTGWAVEHRWMVLTVVLVGLFTTSITITLLAVSLVNIAQTTNEATLAWVIAGPMLVFGLVGPALGKAGDLFARARNS